MGWGGQEETDSVLTSTAVGRGISEFFCTCVYMYLCVAYVSVGAFIIHICVCTDTRLKP